MLLFWEYLIKEKGNLKNAYCMYKLSKKIKQLDLFDENFYLNKYPDIKAYSGNLLVHYLYHGYKENKNPSLIFDTNYYLNKYPEVNNSEQNPLVHYVTYGRKKGNFINKNFENLFLHEEKIKYLNDSFQSHENNLKELKSSYIQQKDDLSSMNSLVDEINNKVKSCDESHKINLSNLTTNIKNINSTIKSQEELLDLQSQLFNDLYIYHEQESRGFLKGIQLLSYEIMGFIDNVCSKYDLEYWVDYGSLLGNVRHNGFIPWDDDADVSMSRVNFDKFLEVIQNEIDAHGLFDKIKVQRYQIPNIKRKGFIQLSYKITKGDGRSLAACDVFPFDYIDLGDKSIEETKKQYRAEYKILTSPNHEDEKIAFNNFNEKMKITSDGEFLIPGPDSAQHVFAIYEKKYLFPLKRVQHGPYQLLIPNNPNKHLISIYGKTYMSMPRIVRFHSHRLRGLIEFDLKGWDIEKVYQEELERMRYINNHFNKK